ncbi:MAG: dTDP-glucose 4,6-dehydratase [Verrucomicrobia bacterium]|jgi:dTDP-glucose 4,6-dehydratase|nr:dTDP-glucose 4,6-dehydratase [Verrucomicrobiota bacterium]MBT7068702.1 dTDP-glucose 4,6-dehydratase [Verrucomicrobiota bacterium]MBT7701851.1 dTDP-glucose 4,6-dehydratase [Verrucomicrobiota bacterium]
MRVLVTGGAGFIGSNFVGHMLATYPEIEIVNMDVLTYAGNLENLAAFEDDERHILERRNIASQEDVESVFRTHEIDIVVNFAAESHVDRSLHVGAEAFIRTNVMGVQMLLDAARVHGVQRFVQISTDEVYGSLGPEGRFTEDTPLAPNNPYAATKAAADLLVRAAHKSHGIDAVITRCSNNFGPYQFPEKLIPLMIANALEGKPLPVYGDGMNVRDWIYVLDHCRAIDDVMRKGRSGEVYNIGSDHDVPNMDIVTQILGLLDKPPSLIQFVEDRPGHDRRYAMDSSKLRDELGWAPALSFEDGLKATVQWYLDSGTWLEHVRSGAYQGYYEMLYGERGPAA